MRYYAHFGHKDFILALGYRGDMIREFFLTIAKKWRPISSSKGAVNRCWARTSTTGITFVDTGLHPTSTTAALRQACREGRDVPRQLLGWSDDFPGRLYQEFRQRNAIASFVAVRLRRVLRGPVRRAGHRSIPEPVSAADYWINGGFLFAAGCSTT